MGSNGSLSNGHNLPTSNGGQRNFDALFATSHTAKIWGVALRQLGDNAPPTSMPEYTLPGESKYVATESSFWTSGFFAGSLHLLYERSIKWPEKSKHHLHPLHLQHACRWWSHELLKQASQRGTHDLGFLIQPWAKLGWELDQNQRCYTSLVVAAYGLADRFDPKVGCIRSWDTCVNSRYSFPDPDKDFLVIIDNMMNLDLLYQVAELEQNPRLAEIATCHAITTMKSHIRTDNSTCHVVNFDQTSGKIKESFTNQGYSDESCWARGQAWAIAGYAECYLRTKDRRFLETAIKLADYFLRRLPEDLVPYWDFDAPLPGPRDTSSAMIAVYGMLLIYQSGTSGTKYLEHALQTLDAVIASCSSPEATFVEGRSIFDNVDLGGHDMILQHATINNNKFAPKRLADHGLVYADYYFLLIGNKILELGLV